MAKPSARFRTPRPSSLRSAATIAYQSPMGSSAPELPVPTATLRDLSSNTKMVAKCLAYDDDNFTSPTAASTLPPEIVPEGLVEPEDDDSAPLLELPDPDVAGDAYSSTVTSADLDDALTASADSAVTQVAAPTSSTADGEEPLREHIDRVLAELRDADSRLSPRSKRLLAALAEAAAAELDPPAATARRLRRAAFWGKVRVGVLAATVATVAAVDVALAVFLLVGRRRNGHHDVLPPT